MDTLPWSSQDRKVSVFWKSTLEELLANVENQPTIMCFTAVILKKMKRLKKKLQESAGKIGPD